VIRRDYDIFERFPDGSTLWKACVRGRFEAQRKIDEFAERSENQFFMIDIQEQFLSPSSLRSMKSKSSAKAVIAIPFHS
jgi:hypothetical protein